MTPRTSTPTPCIRFLDHVRLAARIALGIMAFTLVQTNLVAQTNASSSNPCPRFAEGSSVTQPPELFSSNGKLTVSLSYNTAIGSDGNPLFCFTTPDGKESPTLHVRPGDRLVIKVKNNLPVPTSANSMQMAVSGPNVCAATTMNAASVNIHYHGTNTSPTCGQDEVIKTVINSGETFTYNVKFPADEPPGLYWYHPHIHGIAEGAVQGGASGAIIVDGIESLQPAVLGLPQRLLLVRDQLTPCGDNCTDPATPAWDVSLNYIPVIFPNYTPAIIQMKPKEKQFWRVGNISADLILDVQLQYDGVPQPLQIVALDGVPIGSQDGTRQGKLITQNHILIPPASRAEFIIVGPPAKVKQAIFLTQAVDTGPDGDSDPARPLAAIKVSASAPAAALLAAAPAKAGRAWRQRFEGLAKAQATAQRSLYFSEDNPNGQFFITVEGQTPTLFDPTLPPAIVTTQGSVEDWTIENRALENHEFHMHQIHFLLLARNGVPVPPKERQFLDMVDLPYWTGEGPYPSVTVRMDFRGPDIGDFVYHCHILEHEDKGMMAIIRVLPASSAKKAGGGKTVASRKETAPSLMPVQTTPDAKPAPGGITLLDRNTHDSMMAGMHHR